MFIVRSVRMEDLEGLYQLSHLGTFISLPKNKVMLQAIIESSCLSFKKPHKLLYKNNYIFVLEDMAHKKVIGVSIIHPQHGTDEEPHFFLRVSQEHKYSKSLNTGFVHGILKLGYETNGPTEIGGLVLEPEYRNHTDRLGKQLSYSRFLYMSLFPDRFKEEVHCELLPPFDEKGNSPLWEAIGRRFMNMDYIEADLLSRQNKEFILNLYPSNTIYVTLLPLEARNAIGKVGQQTMPVKKMLEDIGFKYINEVDPFDGGPHYRCLLKDILPIKNKFKGKIKLEADCPPNLQTKKALLKIPQQKDDFYTCKVDVKIHESNIYVGASFLETFPFLKDVETDLIFL